MYLNDLHNVFDSWYLAMAAYNAGERRIMNAIMSGKTRNFWELVELKKLPPETINYIPKFIAAATIGQNLLKSMASLKLKIKIIYSNQFQ